MAEEQKQNPVAQVLNADQLAKEFKEHSVAEFFKKNKQMLGLTGKIRTLTTIIHEYVTNSLDACEEAGILPELEVKISELGNEYYEIAIKDNGPGLTKNTVGKALGQLLAGTKFHRLMQMRGQQGIGAAGCTMLALVTTGKPVQVISGTSKHKPFMAEITIDPKKNEPKIVKIEDIEKDFKGLAIKAKFKDVKYQKSEQAPLEYLRRTAIANPHAKISFTDPAGEKFVFDRTSTKIPKRSVEVKPHPKGVTVDELLTMSKTTQARKIASFLKTDFDRMGEKSILEVSKKVTFDLNKDPKKLAWEEAEEIIKCFKEMTFIAPSLDGLSPIGEDRIRASIKNIVEPEFLSVLTRKPTVYRGGFAFQVEAGIAYGGNAGKGSGEKDEHTGQEIKRIEIMRFANRVPLLFDTGGCALTKAVQSLDWKRYGVKSLDNSPLSVFIHMLSVHIPYTGAGKQAVSDEDEVMEELRLALMQSARQIWRFVAGKRKREEKEKKKKLFLKYATEVAIAVHELTGKKRDEIEKKLHNIVLKKLKLEEQIEKKELEEEAQKIVDKNNKNHKKTKKGSKK
ncbi:MAG: DNA topoisomerase VI subunit B [Candidatus Diapherotrites archaeon]|nr:DNA topoisomerase VI subunit B [Candidatus Diapherotrites archaeon]